jgi:hypothetical protein
LIPLLVLALVCIAAQTFTVVALLRALRRLTAAALAPAGAGYAAFIAEARTEADRPSDGIPVKPLGVDGF